MFIPMAIPMTTVMISRARDDDSVQQGVSHEHSGCISSHLQGTANTTVIMRSPGNHYAYHEKDHRNRDEVIVIVGVLSYEIDAPGGACSS